MSHIVPPAPGNGPWRILLLDRDPADPKWLIATVSLSSDTAPAVLATDGRYTGWEAVTEWVRLTLGRSDVALVPLAGVLAWRVDEGRPR